MGFWVSDSTKKDLADNIVQHKNIYILNGIIFIALGIFAAVAPLLAAKFLFVMLGCLFLITGLFQLFANVISKRHWSYYIITFLAIIAGGVLIARPEAGFAFFGLIIAVFLLLQGCMQLFYASIYAPFRGWGWMLASGFLSIALSLFIFMGWPLSAGWFFGFLIAINFIMFGFSLLMITKNLGESSKL